MNSPADFPTPFEKYATTVPPEWIDLNGHMNMTCYEIVFNQGSRALGSALGFSEAYVAEHHQGVFAAETHTLYFRELLLGDEIHVRTLLAGADEKRLHFAHEIIHTASGERAAAQEVLFLHVDLALRKVSPFPEDMRRLIQTVRHSHRAAPRPEWLGRHIATLTDV